MDQHRNVWPGEKEGLSYVGNAITDIQIMSFEFINNYGLSWNYCSAGAADMAALADLHSEANHLLIKHYY